MAVANVDACGRWGPAGHLTFLVEAIVLGAAVGPRVFVAGGGAMTDESIGSLFERLVDRVLDRAIDRLLQRLHEPGSDYVDQSSSPLGSRRHISAIRDGKLPGVQVGRRYVARAADVNAFIRNSPTECIADEPLDEVDRLASEFGLQKAKGGK